MGGKVKKALVSIIQRPKIYLDIGNNTRHARTKSKIAEDFACAYLFRTIYSTWDLKRS